MATIYPSPCEGECDDRDRARYCPDARPGRPSSLRIRAQRCGESERDVLGAPAMARTAAGPHRSSGASARPGGHPALIDAGAGKCSPGPHIAGTAARQDRGAVGADRNQDRRTTAVPAHPTLSARDSRSPKYQVLPAESFSRRPLLLLGGPCQRVAEAYFLRTVRAEALA